MKKYVVVSDKNTGPGRGKVWRTLEEAERYARDIAISYNHPQEIWEMTLHSSVEPPLVEQAQ